MNAFVSGVQSPTSDWRSFTGSYDQPVGRPFRFTGDPTLQAPDRGAMCRLEKRCESNFFDPCATKVAELFNPDAMIWVNSFESFEAVCCMRGATSNSEFAVKAAVEHVIRVALEPELYAAYASAPPIRPAKKGPRSQLPPWSLQEYVCRSMVLFLASRCCILSFNVTLKVPE